MNGIELNKSALDGFDSAFYKAVWDMVSVDMMQAIQHVFSNDKLLRAWNATSTLVPRRDGEILLDLRHIA